MNITIHTHEVPEFPHMFSDEDLRHIAASLRRATTSILLGDTGPRWRIMLVLQGALFWKTAFRNTEPHAMKWQEVESFVCVNDNFNPVLPDQEPPHGGPSGERAFYGPLELHNE